SITLTRPSTATFWTLRNSGESSTIGPNSAFWCLNRKALPRAGAYSAAFSGSRASRAVAAATRTMYRPSTCSFIIAGRIFALSFGREASSTMSGMCSFWSAFSSSVNSSSVGRSASDLGGSGEGGDTAGPLSFHGAVIAETPRGGIVIVSTLPPVRSGVTVVEVTGTGPDSGPGPLLQPTRAATAARQRAVERMAVPGGSPGVPSDDTRTAAGERDSGERASSEKTAEQWPDSGV